ncbi:MAG: secretion protein HylD, partial [Alphaproteobacteria bacterium]|nr:secretion protein HylD [Alphaproteobacteria bacterium]
MVEDRTTETEAAPPEGRAELVALPEQAHLPVPVPPPALPQRGRRWRKRGMLLLLAAAIAAIGGGYWYFHAQPALPLGFAMGNGRLEADEIDIDTKFAGRIAAL